jgi:sulfur carrier protein
VIVRVNGEPREVDTGATIDAIVGDLLPERPPRGIAVAVDAEVVPRTAWEETVLAPGANVEVLTAIQGG